MIIEYSLSVFKIVFSLLTSDENVEIQLEKSTFAVGKERTTKPKYCNTSFSDFWISLLP